MQARNQANRVLHFTSTVKPKKYWFVDTNVISGYINREYNTPLLPDFVNDPNNRFFYTETVKKEHQYYELSLGNSTLSVPPQFKFIDSRMTTALKERAYLDVINVFKLTGLYKCLL